MDDVVARENPAHRPVLRHEDRRVLAGQPARDLRELGIGIDHGERFVRHLPDLVRQPGWILHDRPEQGRLGDRSDRPPLLQHRKLRDVVLFDEVEGFADRRPRPDGDEGPCVRLGFDQVGGRHPLGTEHPVLRHPLVVVDLREIALAGIAQDAHHAGFRIIFFLRHIHRDLHDEAGRAADEHPFLTGDPARHVEGVPIAHLPELIDQIEVQGGRDLVVADPLDHVGRARLDDMRAVVGREDRADRIAGDHPDLRILLLQVPRRSGDRPSGARRRHEVGDAALSLLPDLRPGGGVMRLRVYRIVVLISEDRVRPLLGDALGKVVVIVGVVRRDG